MKRVSKEFLILLGAILIGAVFLGTILYAKEPRPAPFSVIPLAQVSPTTQTVQKGFAFDLKDLIQLFSILGSIVLFAFYNGTKFGKIMHQFEVLESKITEQQTLYSECRNHSIEERKSIRTELGITKQQMSDQVEAVRERLVRMETILTLHKPNNIPT